MLQWEHFNEPSVVTVFLALLLNADRDGKTDINLGGLMAATKLGRHSIKGAIAKLVKSGEITRQKYGSRITTTITNWSEYQLGQNSTQSKKSLGQNTTQYRVENWANIGPKSDPIQYNKNNKKEQENIVVADAHTHTREGLIAEANVDLRIEQGCKSLGIDPATYQELLDAVINDWEFTNVPDEEWTMFHLLQTMRIKNNIKKRENNGQAQNGNNRQPVAAGRADRASAIAATMAALGAAGTQTESLPY